MNNAQAALIAAAVEAARPAGNRRSTEEILDKATEFLNWLDNGD